MVYCDMCAMANSWPGSNLRSHGPCQECGRLGDCNDVPARLLPSLVVTIIGPEGEDE